MSSLITLNLMLLAIAVMANILLATFVYKNNKNSATNQIYVGLSVVMSIWLIMNFLSLQPTLANDSLILIRLSLFFATLLNAFFFILSKTLPSQKLGLKTVWLVILIAVTSFVMLLTLTPYVFKGIRDTQGSITPIPGLGIAVFGIFSVGLNLLAVTVLLIRHRKSKGEEKQQIRTVMLGLLLMFGLIIITIFLPVVFLEVNFFVPLLPLYALAFLGITAYAIVKYHLFDIKIIATEALVFSIWIIFGAKIFSDNSSQDRILDGLILFATVVFGIFLTKSVKREVEQREKLEILTKQLSEANEKLKELDHIKSEFLSFASHQIKAPLAAIKGFATLIYDGTYGQVPDKVFEAAHKIASSVDRMVQLVTDFLNLRKIEEGKVEYKFEKADVIKIIKETADELRLLAQNKKLDFSYESTVGEVWASVDVQRIRQVFQNLIENSIKYTDAGFVKVKVEVKDASLIFSVSDSGHGISKELLPHLFEEFRRDGKEKQIEGTGLGLFIAKSIVESHHSKIWAESEGSGQGSTFFVELPFA